MKKIQFLLRFLCICAVIGSITPSAAFAGGDDLVLTVSESQTLIQICNQYLKNPGDWRKIGRINKLGNANLIYPGQKLIIPFHMLKTTFCGEVAFLKGNVSRRSAGKDWEPLKPGDDILEGDEIRTGADEGVEFRCVDESEILLRSGTGIKINQCRQENEDTFIKSFYLEVGRIITRLRRITGKESRYSIETPSAVAAARGTRFRVRADRETTFTEVLEGSVRVGAMEEYVDVKENEGSRVKKGAPPAPPRKLLDPPRPLDLKEQYVEFPARIRFSRIDGAVSYRVLLTRDKEMKDIVMESIIQPDSPFVIPALSKGVYHASASSIDDIGLESIPSEAAPIRLWNTPDILVPERSHKIIIGK